MSVLAVAVLVLLIAVVASRGLARSMVRRGQMPEERLQEFRTALVKLVGEESRARHQAVGLRKVWRAWSVSAPQRYVILDDLLERRVLIPAYSSDTFDAFLQKLRWDWLRRPVSVVMLSDLDWQQLASGKSPSMVANGDLIIVSDSPGAGVISRSAGAQQSVGAPVTLELVHQVVAALRLDAAELRPGNPLRERAEAYAEHLTSDARQGHWESVKGTLGDLLAFMANSAALWAATLAILQSHG